MELFCKEQLQAVPVKQNGAIVYKTAYMVIGIGLDGNDEALLKMLYLSNSKMDGSGSELGTDAAAAIGLFPCSSRSSFTVGWPTSLPRGSSLCRVEELLSSWIVCSPLTEPCLLFTYTALHQKFHTGTFSSNILAYILGFGNGLSFVSKRNLSHV